jgi:hypothetical protein
MTTVSFDQDLRLRTPHDILAAVPYLMGHYPADSLVAIGLRGDRLFFHVRGDLPPAGAPEEDVDAFAEHFAGVLAPQGCDGILLVGYGSVEQVARAERALRVPLRTGRIRVYEVFRATRDRFWSMLCPGGECCPAEGRPYDVESSAVAAAATVAGFVVLPDRESIVATFAAPTGERLAAIEAATARARDRLGELVARSGSPVADLVRAGRTALAAARAHYANGGRLTDDEVGRLTVLLVAPPVRDVAWRRIDRTSQTGSWVWEHLWTDVLRRCDPQYAAAPGVLLGYALWRAGDGLRANIAVARALTADPDYLPALFMADVLTRALSPSTVHRSDAGPRAAVGRRLARARAANRRRR